jgi:hypothetical protein
VAIDEGGFDHVTKGKIETAKDKRYVLVGDVPGGPAAMEYALNTHIIPDDLLYAVRVIHLFNPVLDTDSIGPYWTLSKLLTIVPQCVLNVDVSNHNFRPLIHWHALASAVEANVFRTRRG